jgi:hypothetical protein
LNRFLGTSNKFPLNGFIFGATSKASGPNCFVIDLPTIVLFAPEILALADPLVKPLNLFLPAPFGLVGVIGFLETSSVKKSFLEKAIFKTSLKGKVSSFPIVLILETIFAMLKSFLVFVIRTSYSIPLKKYLVYIF